jgi:hypothetical protein
MPCKLTMDSGKVEADLDHYTFLEQFVVKKYLKHTLSFVKLLHSIVLEITLAGWKH